MPRPTKSSVLEERSAELPLADAVNIDDYRQHHIQLSLPSDLYRRITVLAQKHTNPANISNDLLSEEELDFVRKSMQSEHLPFMDRDLKDAFALKQQGKPLAKQFAVKLHRVNRSTLILHLLALGLQHAEAAAKPGYTYEQAKAKLGIVPYDTWGMPLKKTSKK